MLDNTTNTPALLPQQAAASAYNRCQAPSGCRPRWYVVQSQPKAERTAHAALHLKGYEPYLPLITTRWRDRTWHTQPLFAGYLFCRLDLSRPWYPIRWCPGVFSLLSINGTPTPCPDAVLDALRATEALRATPMPPSALWAPGMPCRLATGAFAGHDAVVTEVGHDMALVALMMFGHLRTVSVPLDCLTTRDDG
jgi:transcription antitermination factor NusG